MSRLVPMVALLLSLSLPAVAAPVQITFSVPGIACKACAGDIQGQLSGLTGVRSVAVDVARKQVVVRYDDSRVTATTMLNAMDSMGFTGRIQPTTRAAKPAPSPAQPSR